MRGIEGLCRFVERIDDDDGDRHRHRGEQSSLEHIGEQNAAEPAPRYGRPRAFLKAQPEPDGAATFWRLRRTGGKR